MNSFEHNQAKAQRVRPTDWPHIIKWILLIILLISFFLQLFAAEPNRLFAQQDTTAWLRLFITLMLIVGVIILMCVQRSLKCEILTPKGCTEETTDPSKGILFVNVTGTASGGAFGYYTIAIQKDGDPPQPATLVTYPTGGSTGTSPVLNGDLAKINTTGLSDGAYTITLTVFPVGSGPSKVCTTTFNLLKVAVWIRLVRGILPVPNIFDENARLLAGAQELSFGGLLGLHGSAFIYECDARKVKQVEMRYALLNASSPEPLQPAPNTSIPAAWPESNRLLPILEYDTSKYFPWTKIGMADTSLLNTWGTCTIGTTSYPALVAQAWQSRDATGPSGGKYVKLLLAARDTSGASYYDSQKVWIDNHQVIAQIVRFQRYNIPTSNWIDVPKCTDLLMSWGIVRIIGIAWDALIDSAYPETLVPNDNFDQYSLSYYKQFNSSSPSAIAITAPNTRVPNPSAFPLTSPTAPTVVNADVLAEWDLRTLDAGPDPSISAPEPKPQPCGDPPAPLSNGLYRGCACTYTLALNVSDTTVSDETSVHQPTTYQSLKIINDLT
jgi:uncharacterized integral membrane protein